MNFLKVSYLLPVLALSMGLAQGAPKVSGDNAAQALVNRLGGEGTRTGLTQGGSCQVEVLQGCGELNLTIKDAYSPNGQRVVILQSNTKNVTKYETSEHLVLELTDATGRIAKISVFDGGGDKLVQIDTDDGMAQCFLK